MAASGEKKEVHADAQREYFRTRVGVFLQPIPDEILARTQKIAESAGLSESSQVLDVGTGTGALITHFLLLGVNDENITGVDLSDEMLKIARERYPKVKFLKADILDADTVIGKPDQFDAVFFNACFGNLFDQKMALQKTGALLRSGGCIIISHPLGKRFVKALHDSDPAIVPFFLPEKEQLEAWANELKLELSEFIDEEDFYLARLVK
ncbi:MAG TPA: class I SAM-dependent methyltransferase [Candidatus Melainabacteria bacterium]|nr:class I SAM-dependent methyltransferase [Candidatus Melainabacteria bacterium]HIN64222.1 class I SAM-dependent methyltransferase [Candidatus Obscuribacterales bacterium]